MLSLMFIIGSMTMLLLQRNSLTIALLLSQFQNFSYVRDPKITLKMYENLKNGTSYDDAVKTLGTPDVLFDCCFLRCNNDTSTFGLRTLVAKKGVNR